MKPFIRPHHDDFNINSAASPAPTVTGKAQASWRDALPVHPAAEMFPRMSEVELRELGEDIRAHGLTSPIVIYKECGFGDDDPAQYSLLDGRNRLDAMALVGIQFELHFKRWRRMRCKGWRLVSEIDDGIHDLIRVECFADPFEYVFSANIHRRHLTAEQKRDLIGKLLKADPKKSDRQIAETVKASPTTVGTIRSKMEQAGDVSKLDTRRDTKGRKQPASKPKPPPTAIPKDEPAVTSNPDHKADGPNPLVAAWDKSNSKQRHDFVLARKIEIMRAQARVGWSAFGDVPPYADRGATDEEPTADSRDGVS
jgi:hypothetical protein